jgi:hypothetical protein
MFASSMIGFFKEAKEKVQQSKIREEMAEKMKEAKEKVS